MASGTFERMDEADAARVAGGFSSGDGHTPSPLFRPEAVAAAATTGMGKPIALLPVSWGVLTSALALCIACCVAFLFTGNYTRKESAVGVVRSAGGQVRVAVPSAGIVRRIMVEEGQRVRAGQTLMTIDTIRAGMDGRPLDDATAETLDREIANLQERLSALDAAAGIERAAAPSRIAALEGQRAAAREQERGSRARLTLAREALAKLAPVAERGFISGETMRRREEEVISLGQAVAEARGEQARLTGQIEEARSQISQRPLSVVQERGQLLDLLARARRERADVTGQRGFAVVAPSSGVVSAVQVAAGQPIDPQRTPMTIATAGSAVTAEVFVPSRAIGFIETGQRVRVRYDAFPFQRFGAGTGTVRAISATVLRPQEVEAAIQVQEPVYRVVIALESDTIGAYGQRHRVRPGFAVTADIVLDERSFGEWLLDPILALRGRL